MRSPIDLKALHTAGLKSIVKEYEAQETEKLGTLRGGNSGCVTEDGRVIGKCPRLSHLRSEGYQKEVDLNKHLMFQAGLTNEDSWLQTLKREWNGPILCEEEIPILWYTANGTKVTGRPDIVLCHKDPIKPRPVVGLELKLVSSAFTAYNVLAKQQPTLDHLIQAAHYMWQLDIPFKLVYTSRTNFPLGFGSMKKTWDTVPAHYFNDSGHSVEPFIKIYDLWYEGDVLWFATDRLDAPYKTDITKSGIQKYYECTSNIKDSGSLGPRPEEKTVYGSKLSYGCNTCPLKDVCDNYEHDYNIWIDYAKKELT